MFVSSVAGSPQQGRRARGVSAAAARSAPQTGMAGSQRESMLALLESLEQAMVTMNRTGEVTFWNKGAVQLRWGANRTRGGSGRGTEGTARGIAERSGGG
eukprot:3270329-Pyramimonas_sp.AAC.1